MVVTAQVGRPAHFEPLTTAGSLRNMHVLAFCGSDRTGSFNAQLLDRAVAMLEANDITVDRVAAPDHAFPLFSQNIENDTGIPADVHALFERFGAADVVLIAAPEYNGGYSPLYKNTIDWLTRIEMTFLAEKYLGLITASPGPGGGARGASLTRQQLENMRLTVHPEDFAVPKAHEALAGDDVDGLADWVDGFVAAAQKAE